MKEFAEKILLFLTSAFLVVSVIIGLRNLNTCVQEGLPTTVELSVPLLVGTIPLYIILVGLCATTVDYLSDNIPGWWRRYGKKRDMNWWAKNSFFLYPFGLFNLLHFKKEQIEVIRKAAPDNMFILTDSGGFQVVSGKCDLNWETSLLRQIELTADKIFSLDKPITLPS